MSIVFQKFVKLHKRRAKKRVPMHSFKKMCEPMGDVARRACARRVPHGPLLPSASEIIRKIREPPTRGRAAIYSTFLLTTGTRGSDWRRQSGGATGGMPQAQHIPPVVPPGVSAYHSHAPIVKRLSRHKMPHGLAERFTICIF